MPKRTKGQTEIIGLVIVVIILVIAGLLYLRFGLKQSPKQQITIETIYADHLLNAILNVKICDKQVSEIIVDCFNKLDICKKDSCEYVKTQTEDIMTKLNVKEFRNYYFYAEKDGEREKFSSECDPGTVVDRTIVGTNDEDYKVVLKLC